MIEGGVKLYDLINYCYNKVTDKAERFLKKQHFLRFLTLWVEGSKGNNIFLEEGLLDDLLFTYLTKNS